jgi:hypothetical protein
LEQVIFLDVATSKLTPVVRIYLGPSVFYYDLPEDKLNGCNTLVGTVCPLDENEDVVYRLSMKVPYVPAVALAVELTLQNEFGDDITCFSVDLDVQD